MSDRLHQIISDKLSEIARKAGIFRNVYSNCQNNGESISHGPWAQKGILF